MIFKELYIVLGTLWVAFCFYKRREPWDEVGFIWAGAATLLLWPIAVLITVWLRIEIWLEERAEAKDKEMYGC